MQLLTLFGQDRVIHSSFAVWSVGKGGGMDLFLGRIEYPLEIGKGSGID